MNQKKTLALFALMAVLIASLALSGPSDGAVAFDDTDPVRVTIPFDDMGGGAIAVTLLNDGTDERVVSITVKEYPDRTMASLDGIAVPAMADGASGKKVQEIRLSFSSPGDKFLQITITDGADATTFGYNISVSHSIWKDTTTYLLIMIVVIVIAIAAYIRMRGVPGKKAQPAKTFTEMEAEKKADREAKSSGGTERRKYEKNGKRK